MLGKLKIASFFSGCGGLDLGFTQAGMDVIWANDNDASVCETYKRNHKKTNFVLEDLSKINPNEIPECDGFIGGPPCQSWSVAGKQRGLDDKRGRLFLKYIDFINSKKPKFFLIENVKGLLDIKFKDVFDDFLYRLDKAGYDVKWDLLDAVNYRIPQNRERVFLIGFRKELKVSYCFPKPIEDSVCMQDALGDIVKSPRFFTKARIDTENEQLPNHDVFAGEFGPFYYRGNRRRAWDRPSFTIHATGQNIPLHPSSPRMLYYGHEKWAFIKENIHDYRRLSVRECARLQTFPDRFLFVGNDILKLYKMIGNAVPPRLGYVLANSIINALSNIYPRSQNVVDNAKDKAPVHVLVGYFKSKHHYDMILNNQLYCVRSDGRKGSMYKDEFESSPKFLCLHNRENMKFFELDMDNIFVANDTYLKELGFSVSGKQYLCFKLKNKKELSLQKLGVPSSYKLPKIKGFAPHIITIDKFFSYEC